MNTERTEPVSGPSTHAVFQIVADSEQVRRRLELLAVLRSWQIVMLVVSLVVNIAMWRGLSEEQPPAETFLKLSEPPVRASIEWLSIPVSEPGEQTCLFSNGKGSLRWGPCSRGIGP